MMMSSIIIAKTTGTSLSQGGSGGDERGGGVERERDSEAADCNALCEEEPGAARA
jgi:hypothetical protein